MTERPSAQPAEAGARIALARDPIRTLGVPALAAVPGALALAAAPFAGPVGVALAVVGGAAVGLGTLLGLRIRALRLTVETDYLHLTGIGVNRRYHLVRGDLKRLPTRGPRAVPLRTRLGALGWTVGPATLATGEQIEVIRLGSTPSVVLVPTDRGRVALAVESEPELLTALATAAHARAAQPMAPPPVQAVQPPVQPPTEHPVQPPVQAVQPPALATETAIPPTVPAPPPVERPVQPPAPATETAIRPTAPAPPPVAPPAVAAMTPATRPPSVPPMAARSPARPLTGIERTMLEERLAMERRAALAGAREEQAAASFATTVAALTPAGMVIRTAPIRPPFVAPTVPAIPAPPPAGEPSTPGPALDVTAVPAAVPPSSVTSAPITPAPAPARAALPPAGVPAATATAATAAAAAVPAATVPAATATAAAAAGTLATAAAVPRARRIFRAPAVSIPRRRPSRPMARRVGRPQLTPTLVLLTAPLAASLLLWAVTVIVGSPPAATGFDPLAMALILCGPAAMLAVVLVQRRWPRLAGLTSVAALIALLLVVRAVFI